MTDVADKCSIVTEQQWRAMGALLPPRARESNGSPGCQYQSSQAGETGWGVFVAAVGSSYKDEVAMMDAPTSTGEIDGYPTSTYGDASGCIVLADIADQGHLIANAANAGASDAPVDLCQKANEFAAAAIQNLPNA